MYITYFPVLSCPLKHQKPELVCFMSTCQTERCIRECRAVVSRCLPPDNDSNRPTTSDCSVHADIHQPKFLFVCLFRPIISYAISSPWEQSDYTADEGPPFRGAHAQCMHRRDAVKDGVISITPRRISSDFGELALVCGYVVPTRLSNLDGLLECTSDVMWAAPVLIFCSGGGCMTRQPRRSRIRETP